MSATSILIAFKGIVAAFTTAPVYWPNEKIVTPDPPSPFVSAEITGLVADLLGSGTYPVSARHGFIRFHVMAPFGDALEELYGIADTLGGLFAVVANAGCVTGLNTFAPTAPEIGAQSEDGLWFGVSISVPWVYWATAAA